MNVFYLIMSKLIEEFSKFLIGECFIITFCTYDCYLIVKFNDIIKIIINLLNYTSIKHIKRVVRPLTSHTRRIRPLHLLMLTLHPITSLLIKRIRASMRLLTLHIHSTPLIPSLPHRMRIKRII